MKFLIQTLIFFLTLVGTVQAQDLPKKTDKYGITMIKLPAGSFMMGADISKCPADDPFTAQDESDCLSMFSIKNTPQHKVTLDMFWMAQTEITQEQYYKVMGTNPSSFKSEKLGYRSAKNPVENVSWFESKTFCEKLGYRLPTEAEWEYAARAGTKGNYYGEVNDIAWHVENSKKKTHPVATKAPNDWELYDMIGNVWEWTADWYGSNYYNQSPVHNPTGPISGNKRMLRGGSFSHGDITFLRVSARFSINPDTRVFNGGFRCVQ